MAFPATATFGQLFPFQTSFEAKLFSAPETNSTAKSENQDENESNWLVR